MFVSIIFKNSVKRQKPSANFGRKILSICTKSEEKIFENRFGDSSNQPARLVTKPLSCNGNQHFEGINSIGQPTPITHPHLLAVGELLPGLKLEEFCQRRKTFMNLIFEDIRTTYGVNAYSIVIVPSATKLFMSEKIPYVFHQNNDYLFLTGCLEPDTLLILSGSCEENFCTTLFVRKRDVHSDVWEGPRTGTYAACQVFGVSEAFYVQDLTQFLIDKVNKHPNHLIYYDLQNTVSEPSLHYTVVNHIQKYNLVVSKSWKNFLDRIRLIKSPAEQQLMQKACEISSAAIRKTIEITKPEMTEHQLFATVDYECRMRGAEILAYPPVVASGKNANFIHYIDNNQMLKDGDLVLMDAGGEYHGYCGDITRTWPVNGKFSQYQRILYEIVLEVEKELVASCETKLSLNSFNEKMIFLLGKHLRKENILKKHMSTESEFTKTVQQLCPHHVGHYLGMDVHDVKSIHKNISLLSGMIVTIEPGLYTKEHPLVHPEFWNLGIRIEDDVLITDTGYKNLTATCPKEIDEIERIMKK